MTLTRPVLAALAAATLVLSACGDEDGTAIGGGGTTTPVPPVTSQPTAPTSAPAASPLEGKVGCEFVTEADIATVVPPGFKPAGPPEERGGSHRCQFQMRKGTEGVYTLDVVIRPDEGLDQVPFQNGVDGWSVTEGTVDKVRPAVQAQKIRGGGQDCLIYMEVGPTSRVDAAGNSSGEDSVENKTCDVVNKLALLVHEKLVKEGL